MRNPACTACELHKTAKTVCMWGSGPSSAPMVIIGQNPGAEEDKKGEPFIGASGKLLRGMLEAAGLKPTDVYITNAVKCFSPGNRKPELSEVKACRLYLEHELKGVVPSDRPKVIVVLGDTALQSLLGKKGITSARKEFHEWNGVPVVATYHPAYALRSPQFTGDLQADLNRATTYVYSKDAVAIDTMDGNEYSLESLNYDPTATWAYDIETNAKDLDDPALEIYMLGICDGRRTVVFRGDNIRLGVSAMATARMKGVRLVGHNAIGFDAEMLFKKFGAPYLMSDDTMILAHVLDENAPLGLEQQACTNLGVKPWKKMVTWDWSNMTPSDMMQAVKYNAEDCVQTYRLAECLFKKSKELGTDRCYDIMQKGTIVFEHHVNHNGIALNVPELVKLKNSLTNEALDSVERLREITGFKRFNINSPKQVATALFSAAGLNLIAPKHTPTGAPSTDDESLKELILNRKWPSMGSPEKIALESLVSARKNLKLVSMLAGYENNAVNLGDHWRIYPHYFSWRTTTHRSTADKGFQLWPHDKRVRGLLTARPGHVLLACDYSQLQMRIAADLSQSESMKRLFTDKIDPHSWLAAQIIGEPDWTKIDKDSEARYCAKPCNFLLLFGAQPFTLRRQALTDYGLVWTEEQAKKYHDIFHDAYKLDPWYSRVAKELKDTGAIRSPLGAIRHLPNIHAGEAKQREEALRQAINAPVQDVEVMIAYLALWECCMAGYNIVAFLHDALYIEVLAELEDESKNQIAYIMETRVPEILDQDYGYKLSVPLEVDIKTTPCYDRV